MTSNYPPPPDSGDPGQQPPPGSPGYPSYPAGEGGMPAYPRGAEPAAAAPVAQPQSIVTAVRLMWAGAALSALGLVVGLLTLGSLKDNIKDQLAKNDSTLTQSEIDTAYNIGIATIIIVSILGIALWLWMARANGKGRKWARIVATVLGALNVIFTLISLGQGQAAAGSVILSVISAVLAIAILVMLWRKESSEFYNARSTPQFS
jgi:hypothetical protein